jgi:hypothetical protein
MSTFDAYLWDTKPARDAIGRALDLVRCSSPDIMALADAVRVACAAISDPEYWPRLDDEPWDAWGAEASGRSQLALVLIVDATKDIGDAFGASLRGGIAVKSLSRAEDALEKARKALGRVEAAQMRYHADRVSK